MVGWPVAEQEVDEPRARSLLRVIPGLEVSTLSLLGVGWDNTVWLVDGRWAFRFPRRATGAGLGGVERAVLPVLTPLLPLPVPLPRWVGGPAGDYPWEFWGGPLVPGVELGRAGLTEGAREPAARALGAFLARLHAPTVATAVTARVTLPTDPNGRLDPVKRAAMADESLRQLASSGLVGPDPSRDALVTRAASSPLTSGAASSATTPVVVHGDLHLRHLLVERGGEASGVIDWGDCCLADPAVDLSIAYAAFTGAARAALFAAYEAGGGRRLEGDRELAARVLALNLCAMLAHAAHEAGDEVLLAESLRGLTRATGP